MEAKSKPREITIINKADSSAPSILDRVEQWAKIGSLIAVPIVLSVIGLVVNSNTQDKTVKQQYVKLATEILSESALSEGQSLTNDQADLREWATRLLSETSPVPLPDSLEIAFARGGVSLRPPDEVRLGRAESGTFEIPAQASTPLALFTNGDDSPLFIMIKVNRTKGGPIEVRTAKEGGGRLLAVLKDLDDEYASLKSGRTGGISVSNTMNREWIGFLLKRNEAVFLQNLHADEAVRGDWELFTHK